MVGKTTNKHIAQLMLKYEERIKHYLPFEIKVVDDLKDCKALSEKEQKHREGERIQRLLQAGDIIILLDEHGREFRSIDFASFLQQQINAGGRRMCSVLNKLTLSQSQRSKNLCLITMNQRKYCYYISM